MSAVENVINTYIVFMRYLALSLPLDPRPQMAHCVTLVQLSVSCDHLIDKDIGSKSDPLCVLLQDVGGGNWTEVRRTMGVKVMEGC